MDKKEKKRYMKSYAASYVVTSIPREIKSSLRVSAFLKCKPIIPASLAASIFANLKLKLSSTKQHNGRGESKKNFVCYMFHLI